MSVRSDVVGVDRAVAALAARQHGVVTRDQLLTSGVSADAIKHRLHAARLIAVYRGIYAVGHTGLSPHGRIQAALLAAGPEASASHHTAAYLDHLTPTLPAVIHVSTLAPARRRRPGLVIHETTRPFAIKHVAGLRATSTLRTLEDLGWPDPLIRDALARRLIRHHQLPTQLEYVPTMSELERRMRRLCTQAGLPQPVAQHPHGPYVIDFAWPTHRLYVETDGYDTHGRRQAFEDDRARDAHLAAQGYIVIRFTWRQITQQPYLVAARLAAALALHASTPVAP